MWHPGVCYDRKRCNREVVRGTDLINFNINEWKSDFSPSDALPCKLLTKLLNFFFAVGGEIFA